MDTQLTILDAPKHSERSSVQTYILQSSVVVHFVVKSFLRYAGIVAPKGISTVSSVRLDSFRCPLWQVLALGSRVESNLPMISEALGAHMDQQWEVSLDGGSDSP